jgi:hypothetical protein
MDRRITTEEAERRRQQWGEFLTGPIFWMSFGPLILIALWRFFMGGD